MENINKDPAMSGSGLPRIENDFYPTIDKEITRSLCAFLLHNEILDDQSTIWECAAGDLAMVNVLSEYFKSTILATDIVVRSEGVEQHDFLKGEPYHSDAIITNPPYGKTLEDFINKGLELILTGNTFLLALLARNEYDCASSRRILFNNPLFAHKIVLTWRPRWFKEGDSSPRHNYAWYIWTAEYNKSATIHYMDKINGKSKAQ